MSSFCESRIKEEMVSVIAFSGYALERLRADSRFALYRGRQPGADASILVLAPALDPQPPADQRRLEHEYSLADDFDPTWAVRPLAIERRDGRSMILFEDTGGDFLEGMLGRPFELTRFLQIAVALAVALREVHQRGLVHKDIRPANVFVNAADRVAPPETIDGTFPNLGRERRPHSQPRSRAGTRDWKTAAGPEAAAAACEESFPERFPALLRDVRAQGASPRALFLDDLQSLDTTTLDLLEHLATHSEVRHLMLVGAYRDNEVGPKRREASPNAHGS
jgi:serine/threonine protein kinase